VFCATDNPTIADLSYNLVWYEDLTSTIPLDYSELLIDGEDYFASQIIDGCESADRIRVTTTVITYTDNTIIYEILTSENMFNKIDIVIQVNSEGTYIYSVDSSTFQESNIFTNLSYGLHTVNVVDIYGCKDEVEKEFLALDYPSFFTPNNDGVNDYWNLNNTNQLAIRFNTVSDIYIFNRFGKVLAKIDPEGQGWDGKYNEKLLPSSDYWFEVKLIDVNGKVYSKRGNFSLVLE